DVFDRSTVQAIRDRYERLLAAAVADPDQPIGALEILSAGERARVLEAWNDTARPVPAAPLPALFEARARRAPGATAVVCGASSLTYGELNARANRLARHLVASGVGPERIVGLALPP